MPLEATGQKGLGRRISASLVRAVLSEQFRPVARPIVIDQFDGLMAVGTTNLHGLLRFVWSAIVPLGSDRFKSESLTDSGTERC